MPSGDPNQSKDSDRYLRRRRQFERCLTLFGRKPVLEALSHTNVRCERLHLAERNRSDATLSKIEALARKQGAEIQRHSRERLSQISRNRRQDQGVAADISWLGYGSLNEHLESTRSAEISLVVALDRVHNPQNLGMLIRSVTAAGSVAVLLPRQGGCDIGPLVIKASAGALFHSTLLRCETLRDGLLALKNHNFQICSLDANAKDNLLEFSCDGPVAMVLGNESEGVDPRIAKLADQTLKIPMSNGIESLNLAVAAALVAYRLCGR